MRSGAGGCPCRFLNRTGSGTVLLKPVAAEIPATVMPVSFSSVRPVMMAMPLDQATGPPQSTRHPAAAFGTKLPRSVA
ncbi:hypothetical protein METH_04785 [Leisingera methylohalidivorans DSM 14336]|uniref:Uncharacterized protein n=1 Tax=Leisingera methylohalidivorans DSM 14336 TaxID=999552 RepID=V9VVW7_9RHOB|nr:hypothetical protein METH_04785 [Leisingera methylohalidivorans DSM 14336]